MHAWSVRSSYFKQIPKGHNHGSSLPSASPWHFIIINVQAYRVSSILNGPRRSKWPNFALLHIWFATSWLSLMFVSLFYVSMFHWILKIHVAFDVLCSCIYLKEKNSKIKSRFPNLSKKREKISNVFGLGALGDNALKCILVICLCGCYFLITMLNLYN